MRRQFILAAGALLLCLPQAMRAQDRAQEFAATITSGDIHAHLQFLASDALEGRETGEPGQRVAAEYLASWFQRLGLQAIVPTDSGNSWFQQYPLLSAAVKDADLTLDGKTTYKFMEDFMVLDKAALGKDISAPLAYAGFGISTSKYDNLAGLDLKGKAAVILTGEPKDASGNFLLSGSSAPTEWSTDPSLKAEALRKAGAVAVIAITPAAVFSGMSSNPRLRHFMMEPTLELVEEDMADPMAVIYVSPDIAGALFKSAKTTEDKLRAQLGSSAKVQPLTFKGKTLSLTADAEVKVVYASNVLGFLEGTDKKDEVIILTAHYDHIGTEDGVVHNGADDDGTGTASVLEMAEAFATAARQGIRPRRSILFMPVSGEEKGLLGSEWYSEHPVLPLENTVCDLNIDMIGRVDKQHAGNSNYVYLIGADKLSTDLHKVSEATNSKYTHLQLDYTYNDPKDPNRFYYRSDHYNFAKHGIPVIFYFTGVHEDYHKPTDDVWKIDFEKTAHICKLVFHTAWEIANRDERLKVDVKNDFPSDR